MDSLESAIPAIQRILGWSALLRAPMDESFLNYQVGIMRKGSKSAECALLVQEILLGMEKLYRTSPADFYGFMSTGYKLNSLYIFQADEIQADETAQFKLGNFHSNLKAALAASQASANWGDVIERSIENALLRGTNSKILLVHGQTRDLLSRLCGLSGRTLRNIALQSPSYTKSGTWSTSPDEWEVTRAGYLVYLSNLGWLPDMKGLSLVHI